MNCDWSAESDRSFRISAIGFCNRCDRWILTSGYCWNIQRTCRDISFFDVSIVAVLCIRYIDTHTKWQSLLRLFYSSLCEFCKNGDHCIIAQISWNCKTVSTVFICNKVSQFIYFFCSGLSGNHCFQWICNKWITCVRCYIDCDHIALINSARNWNCSAGFRWGSFCHINFYFVFFLCCAAHSYENDHTIFQDYSFRKYESTCCSIIAKFTISIGIIQRTVVRFAEQGFISVFNFYVSRILSCYGTCNFNSFSCIRSLFVCSCAAVDHDGISFFDENSLQGNIPSRHFQCPGSICIGFQFYGVIFFCFVFGCIKVIYFWNLITVDCCYVEYNSITGLRCGRRSGKRSFGRVCTCNCNIVYIAFKSCFNDQFCSLGHILRNCKIIISCLSVITQTSCFWCHARISLIISYYISLCIFHYLLISKYKGAVCKLIAFSCSYCYSHFISWLRCLVIRFEWDCSVCCCRYANISMSLFTGDFSVIIFCFSCCRVCRSNLSCGRFIKIGTICIWMCICICSCCYAQFTAGCHITICINECIISVEDDVNGKCSGCLWRRGAAFSGCVCCTFFKIRFKFQYCSDFQFRHRKYICPCAVLRYCISDFLSCCIGIDCFQTSVFQLHTLCRIYSQFNCIACVCFHMVWKNSTFQFSCKGFFLIVLNIELSDSGRLCRCRCVFPCTACSFVKKIAQSQIIIIVLIKQIAYICIFWSALLVFFKYCNKNYFWCRHLKSIGSGWYINSFGNIGGWSCRKIGISQAFKFITCIRYSLYCDFLSYFCSWRCRNCAVFIFLWSDGISAASFNSAKRTV